MGGWYSPRGGYDPAALGGLPVAAFVEALAAEGVLSGNFDPHQEGCRAPASTGPGNKPLHTHPLFNTIDVLNDGKPLAQANAELGAGRRASRRPPERPRLPVVESLGERTLTVPWFKHDRPAEVARFAAAYIKVARQHTKIQPS